MIEFKDVTKVYDSNGTHALENVNIKIEDGEFVFVVGSSGAGKSTFLKLIMHEETPTSGEIVINGKKTSKLKRRQVPYLRRHMGIVFQDFRLIEKMNVFDNVAFAMRAVGESTATIKKRVPYVLDLVGLKNKMKLDVCTIAAITAAFGYLVSAFFGNTMYYTTPYLFILLGLSCVPDTNSTSTC